MNTTLHYAATGVTFFNEDSAHSNDTPDICTMLRELFPDARHITVLTGMQKYATQELITQDDCNNISDACALGNNDVVIVHDGDEGVTPNLLTTLETLSINLGDDTTQFAYITGAFYSQRTISAIKYEMPRRLQGIRVFLKNSWEESCADQIDKNYTVRKDQPKKKDFMCFNKNMRDPRILFLGLLRYYQLFDKGYVSQGPNIYDTVTENIASWRELLVRGRNSDYWKGMWNKRTLDNVVAGWRDNTSISIRLHSENDEEFWADNDSVDFSNASHIQDKELYEAVHYFVVTETAFQTTNPCPDVVSADCHFLTEKTYRHIGLRMPFILLSRPGTLALLREAGYQTFHPHIDETYDTKDNDQERMLTVLKEMERLHTFNNAQWNEWHKIVDKITEFNYNVLKSKTMELTEITEELK